MNPQTQQPQQGDHIDALIQALDHSSSQAQQIFGGMGQGTNSPYIWVGNGFQKNPNFLNPQQQVETQSALQQVTGTQPAQTQKIADEEAAKIYSDFAAQNKLPLKPQDLTPIIDSAGNPAPLGTTQEQVNSGKYHVLTSAERDSLPSLNQAQTILNQIESASKAINTTQGNTFSTSQHISGYLKSLIQDPNAVFLNQSQGVLGPILKDLLAVNRFNSGEVANVSDILPKPTDTAGQADAKLQRFRDLLTSTKKSLGITTNQQLSDIANQYPPAGAKTSQPDPLGLR